MTQEEIIELAKEAGLTWVSHNQTVRAFAQLVAAKEREACWKIACEYTQLAQSHTCLAVADAIKARGKS